MGLEKGWDCHWQQNRSFQGSLSKARTLTRARTVPDGHTFSQCCSGVGRTGMQVLPSSVVL